MKRKPKTIIYARWIDLDNAMFELFYDIYPGIRWGQPLWKEWHHTLQLIEEILFDED